MSVTIEQSAVEVAERFLGAIDAPSFAVSPPGKSGSQWAVWCYWPNGDVIRDIGCHGHGATLESAITSMWEEVERAKQEVVVLKTAAECKAAVIALIQQHDAAPASFRDAVDALPVKPELGK